MELAYRTLGVELYAAIKYYHSRDKYHVAEHVAANTIHNLATEPFFMIAIEGKTRSAALLISSVLFRAFFLGVGLLILSCLPILFLTDQVYAVHSNMIDIPRPEYNALLFSWLGNLKLLLIVFFLLPAIAIRWALKKE